MHANYYIIKDTYCRKTASCLPNISFPSFIIPKPYIYCGENVSK